MTKENEEWAKTIVKELIHQKVRTFAIAPGSRSTPLVLAIADHPLAQSHVHFDERGAAYYALGYAKASGTPAAIVVTSGTALGNVMPAVMEASHSGIPLIVISADFPPELRNCGANQTTDQVKLFGSFVRFSADIPCPQSGPFERQSTAISCPQEGLSLEYIRSLIASGVQKALYPHSGPIHLNCMFRKPLFTLDTKKKNLPSTTTKIRFAPPKITLSDDQFEQIALDFSRYDKGMIIAGEMPPKHSIDPLISLARRLQWPVMADILSNIRIHGPEESSIEYFDIIMDNFENKKQIAPDFVLHLGGNFYSKPLHELISAIPPEKYLHVSALPSSSDPHHIVTDRVHMDPYEFVKELAESTRGNAPSEYLSLWKTLEERTKETLNTAFSAKEQFKELGSYLLLSDAIDESDALYLSISLPIRHSNRLFFPKKRMGPTYCNRGLSGIDGNIATAVGICEALKRPLIAIVGDQAFLHDMNSLAQIKKTLPLQIIVMNNGGGGIFSHLPIREKKEHCNTYFTASHSLDFESIVEQFDLQYFCPKAEKDLEDFILYKAPKDAPSIIEIQSCKEKNYADYLKFHSLFKGIYKKATPLPAGFFRKS